MENWFKNIYFMMHKTCLFKQMKGKKVLLKFTDLYLKKKRNKLYDHLINRLFNDCTYD